MSIPSPKNAPTQPVASIPTIGMPVVLASAPYASRIASPTRITPPGLSWMNLIAARTSSGRTSTHWPLMRTSGERLFASFSNSASDSVVPPIEMSQV